MNFSQILVSSPYLFPGRPGRINHASLGLLQRTIFFIFQNHSPFIFCKAVFFITLILAFTQQCSTRIDGTTVISRSLLSNKTKIFTQEISASSSVFLFRRNSSILTNLDCRLFTMIYLVHSQIFKSFLKN